MKIKFIAIIVSLMFVMALSACDITSTSTTSQSTTGPTSLTTTTTSLSDTSSTDTTSTITGTTTYTTTVTTTTTSQVTTTLRVFTLQELAVYNGNGGSTAYIAVNNVVYDVTHAQEWSNGWHKGVHYAGTDASTAFESSPHSLSFLSQLPIVGTLAH